jgi:hypothetical protein
MDGPNPPAKEGHVSDDKIRATVSRRLRPYVGRDLTDALLREMMAALADIFPGVAIRMQPIQSGPLAPAVIVHLPVGSLVIGLDPPEPGITCNAGG